MTVKIPIAGYMQARQDHPFSTIYISTVFHFPFLYSYLVFQSQKMEILMCFFGISEKIQIMFSDIISITKRPAIPFGFCIKIELTTNQVYCIYTLSSHTNKQIIKLLQTHVGDF